MSILLDNATLVDLDPIGVERAALRIEEGRIVERAAQLSPRSTDERVDCAGAVVLAGLVNGHTHLYSSLAVGMPPPRQTPRDFPEILEYVWWKLDQALDAEAIEVSARIGALHALRCGTTTLIDHHASPTAIDGSLDRVERGIASVGLRGVLCYETTDRHGLDGRNAGVAENRRYLEQCARQATGQFAGLVGAHAAFTLDDDALVELGQLADQLASGVHIHVAEDPCDQLDANQRGCPHLIDRLQHAGLLTADAVFAHCTHLDARGIECLNASGVTVAHNARSNMNNAVGYAPLDQVCRPVMLGTDGIGSDMLAEARAAWFISRHAHAGLAPDDILAMLAAASQRASRALGVRVGSLQPGAAADVMLTNYLPNTPLHDENVAGHLLFGLSSVNVRSVIVDGCWRLRDGIVVDRDEAEEAATARDVAERLWQRMRDL